MVIKAYSTKETATEVVVEKRKRGERVELAPTPLDDQLGLSDLYSCDDNEDLGVLVLVTATGSMTLEAWELCTLHTPFCSPSLL